MTEVSFTLNGRAVSLQLQETTTALSALRQHLGVTSAKDGCSGKGDCGACTVLWNGKPVMSCTRDASRLQDAEIFTLEGISPRHRQVIARAFVGAGAPQCGYCIPGIALRTAHLLDHEPDADEARVRTVLGPHLCRCTGYTKVVEAILSAAHHWRAGTLPPLPEDTEIGAPATRFRGQELVLGEKPYVDDMSLPGMLCGGLRLSDHPRARITRIDTSAARAMPGVHAVLGFDDLRAATTTGHIRKDCPVYLGVGQTSHCVGTVIAAVAADTQELARRAAASIEVDYELLEPLTDPHQALAESAPQVHEQWPNLAEVCTILRGDAEDELEASHLVVEQTYFTQRVEHAFLEPESALAVFRDDGSVHLWSQGQGVHEDREELARVLGLDEEQVVVELVSNGGGFGGKEDVTVQPHAALLAQATGRPVKLTLTREQSMRIHPKRHPLEMRYRVGFDAKGMLTGAHIRIWGDTGAYLSVGGKVLERAAGHSCSAYHVPSVDIEAYTVYTNNVPSGAFRGFGVNQTSFAMEGVLDRAAEALGLDGFTLREQNLLEPGLPFATGQLMDEGCGARACLEAVEEAYTSHPRAGVAMGIKNTGIGNGMADVGRALARVDGPDHVSLYTGYTEMGQGLHTVCRQILCAETGLSPDQVFVETSTRYAVECGMTTASRGTLLSGEATRRAALALAHALQAAGGDLSALEGQEFPGEFVCDFTVPPDTGGDNPVTHVTFGFAAQVVQLDEEGRVERVVAAHDVGRVMNQATAEGQVQGAVHMGLGHALTEDLPAEGGHLVSTRLKDLHILKAKHTPPVDVILLEVPDPHSAYGIKGMGEIGLVPTAGALASALFRFDGIHRSRLPMKGSPAARAVLPRKLHEPDHE